MKRLREKKYTGMIIASVFLSMILWCNGCGFVSIFGTPTRHEKKIPAEYDLTQHKSERILVLVNQPGWLRAESNLRYHLTETLSESLRRKLRIAPERLVGYEALWKFRSGHPGFSEFSPVEVGAALGAELVLFVTIEAYELERAADTDYYNGSLAFRSALYETATKESLWPTLSKGKRLVVGFDVESRGREVAVQRLVSAAAHCTIRYLHNCPQDEFAISEDQSNIHW